MFPLAVALIGIVEEGAPSLEQRLVAAEEARALHVLVRDQPRIGRRRLREQRVRHLGTMEIGYEN